MRSRRLLPKPKPKRKPQPQPTPKPKPKPKPRQPSSTSGPAFDRLATDRVARGPDVNRPAQTSQA
ncbi:hypothetical protein DF045_19310 [Burkholderia cepacia]|nr:hypothetical protein DF045_19310 [Burkholderia cepacia]